MRTTEGSGRLSDGDPRSALAKGSRGRSSSTGTSFDTTDKAGLTDRGAIPADDPKRNYRSHRPAILEAIRRVLESGSYILGREVGAFETEFARYHGLRDAIGTGSGTDALHLALRTLGVGPGDVVVTTSFTAVATVTAIDLTGATPLLVDVDAGTFTLDPERFERTIAKHRGGPLKAVIPVHLYGHPADMEAIGSIARRHGIAIVEDGAQAH